MAIQLHSLPRSSGTRVSWALEELGVLDRQGGVADQGLGGPLTGLAGLLGRALAVVVELGLHPLERVAIVVALDRGVGRIDHNKGCEELFEFFQGYLRDPSGRLSLVMIGTSLLPIPEHPRIRHLGFLDDVDKDVEGRPALMLAVDGFG